MFYAKKSDELFENFVMKQQWYELILKKSTSLNSL